MASLHSLIWLNGIPLRICTTDEETKAQRNESISPEVTHPVDERAGVWFQVLGLQSHILNYFTRMIRIQQRVWDAAAGPPSSVRGGSLFRLAGVKRQGLEGWQMGKCLEREMEIEILARPGRTIDTACTAWRSLLLCLSHKKKKRAEKGKICVQPSWWLFHVWVFALQHRNYNILCLEGDWTRQRFGPLLLPVIFWDFTVFYIDQVRLFEVTFLQQQQSPYRKPAHALHYLIHR